MLGFRYLNPTYISFDLELIRAVLPSAQAVAGESG
jgi:hypothetical protein